MNGHSGNYKLTEHLAKNGKRSYRATWWEAGNKHRSKTFKSLEERRRWVGEREKTARDVSAVAARAARTGDYVARFAKLPPDAQNALLGGWDRILAAGGTADDLLDAAAEKAASMGGGITVREAAEKHLADLEGRVSRGTAKERRHYLSPLLAVHGDKTLCALTRGVCRDWIEGGATTAIRRHRHSVLSAFLNDCLRRDWLQNFPMTALRKPPAPVAENVAIFTAEEAERVMRAAEEFAPSMVPYFAIGLFAGLRPERELACLREEYIDLEGRTLYVTRSTAKRVERDVPVSENLAAWLAAFPVRGAVGFNRKLRRLVAERAGVAWHSDIMRHTRASFRLALTRDPVRVADEMGHGTDVLRRHYANRRIAPADVERFWEIMPSAKGSGR